MTTTQKYNQYVRLINRGLVVVASTLVIGLFFLYFIWAHPVADDLIRAGGARDIGLLRCISAEYFTWSGRWLGAGLSYFISTLFEIIKVYPLILLVWALIHLLSFCLLIDILFDIPKSSVFLLGALIYAVFLANFPSLREGFYWMTGATENVLAISLSIIFFHILLNRNRVFPKRGKYLSLIILSFLAGIIPGFHEVFGSVFCFILTVATALAFLEKRPSRFVLLSASLCAGIGLLIVVAAPGNLVRLKSIEYLSKPIYPNYREIIFSTKTASYYMLSRMREWILSPSLVAGSLVFLLWPELRHTRPRWGNEGAMIRKICIPVMSFVAVFFCFLATVYLVVAIPERTSDGIYTLFVVGWFTSIFILSREIRMPAFLQEDVILTGLIIVLSFLLFGQNNVRWGMNDLAKAPAFHRQMISRDDFIHASVKSGFRDVRICDKITWPRLFAQHLDMGEDPTDYRNYHWAIYFKANTVQLIK